MSLLANKILLAQQSPILMSSTGITSGGIINFSNPITLVSSQNCINVTTGLPVLTGTINNGEFAINCEVNIKFNSLGLKFFPNPVKSTARIKFINTPPLSDEFQISIWTEEGVMLKMLKQNGYNLFQGLNIDLSEIIIGSYLLKVQSNEFVDAIKFIKVH